MKSFAADGSPETAGRRGGEWEIKMNIQYSIQIQLPFLHNHLINKPLNLDAETSSA